MTTEEREIAELQINLEMLRKLFGWTAEQLGIRLGVTKQTVLNRIIRSFLNDTLLIHSFRETTIILHTAPLLQLQKNRVKLTTLFFFTEE